MKEWSGDNQEEGDLWHRSRHERREKVKSTRLRSASTETVQRLGEEMTSELRLAECGREEARTELHNEGMGMKGHGK